MLFQKMKLCHQKYFCAQCIQEAIQNTAATTKLLPYLCSKTKFYPQSYRQSKVLTVDSRYNKTNDKKNFLFLVQCTLQKISIYFEIWPKFLSVSEFVFVQKKSGYLITTTQQSMRKLSFMDIFNIKQIKITYNQ